MLEYTLTVNNGSIGYAHHEDLPQEYWDIIHATIQTWHEAFTHLSEFRMVINQPILVQIDWKKVKESIKTQNWNDHWKISFKITTVPNDRVNTDCYAEALLHHLFLILNLSNPHCLDLRDVTITNGEREIRKMRLDSDAWFEAWLSAINKYHINVTRLPVSTVFKWYLSLDIGAKQLATNSIERALFALLQYAGMNMLGPSTLVWLRHSLKALYGNITPIALTFELQQKNIILPEQSEIIKMAISNLYDITDRFVNGEYNINHPMEDDGLDSGAWGLQLEISIVYRPILAIIIASIQQMILEYERN